MMPEFSFCEHEEEDKPEYELITDRDFGEDKEFTILRHNTYPRFSANVLQDGRLIEANNSWLDIVDAPTAARAIRKAQEWLRAHI